MKRLTIVAGARPNFVKIAPIIHALKKKEDKGGKLMFRLVHTGQHFDQKMSGDFFEQLNIPTPDSNLDAGGGSQAEQTASIMIRFEQELITNPTDLVLVVGDVTSTMACAITAQKLCIPVAHVEGGIRSNDWSMPEEINRLVTDSISNYFFTTSDKANKNLLNSGVSSNRIFFVGNTMIDTLLANMPFFRKPLFWDEFQLINKHYIVLTLHRPANVDDDKTITEILNKITENSNDLPIVFPVHPRTSKKLKSLNYNSNKIKFVEPLSYLEFNFLVQNSLAVITDSGGVTEECTVMSIPCMTLRNSTERPETVEIGTNVLIGTDPSSIKPALQLLFDGNWKKGKIPPMWDGKSAQRIVEILSNILS